MYTKLDICFIASDIGNIAFYITSLVVYVGSLDIFIKFGAEKYYFTTYIEILTIDIRHFVFDMGV